MTKNLYVATGAYSCGKTTTLEYLREHYGLNVHREAHIEVLKRIGDRADGHPLDKQIKKINDPKHFCPLCNPFEFCEMVLEKQLEIEAIASDNDIIERGFIDPLEYYFRNTESECYPEVINKDNFSNYKKVFLFDVIPEVQIARWGKDKQQRTEEAYEINKRLKKLYKNYGYQVIVVPKDSVENRAKYILDKLNSK